MQAPKDKANAKRMPSMFAKTRRLVRGRPGVLVALAAVAVLVAGCTGDGGVTTSGEESREDIQDILNLVQTGDVAEARQRFDEPHRLLHTTASDLASDDPELSQQLDSATEDLQRELLSSEVDPAALSDAVNRVLELLAQTQ